VGMIAKAVGSSLGFRLRIRFVFPFPIPFTIRVAWLLVIVVHKYSIYISIQGHATDAWGLGESCYPYFT